MMTCRYSQGTHNDIISGGCPVPDPKTCSVLLKATMYCKSTVTSRCDMALSRYRNLVKYFGHYSTSTLVRKSTADASIQSRMENIKFDNKKQRRSEVVEGAAIIVEHNTLARNCSVV